MTANKHQKQLRLINFDPLWACRNVGGHGRIILVEYRPWGMPGDLNLNQTLNQTLNLKPNSKPKPNSKARVTLNQTLNLKPKT